MRRNERTRRMINWMRSTGPTTVPAVAEHFGVSERTIFRDLATLRERGIRILSDPGRGGGIWLR